MDYLYIATFLTGLEKMVCKTYLRGTHAGPSRRVKEQQEGISPNHVRAIFLASVFICLRPFDKLNPIGPQRA